MALLCTPEQLSALSRLWDAVQEVPVLQRQDWLDRLTGEDAVLRGSLQRMLARPSDATTEFLEILPTLLRLDELSMASLAEAGGTDFQQHHLVGPYRLIRKLGQGGMGSVWLAERFDSALRAVWALKLPHPWLVADDLAARFERERVILSSLNHPFIARLYDAGVAAKRRPYLALEYVTGSPLTMHCDARRMNVRARMEIFLQVLEAVRYAHARGVVHCDLKPSNILTSADGDPHLLDFGIATLLRGNDPSASRGQACALTPAYAAPEQIAGHPASPLCDVYSLGIMLYELLCGRRPYHLTSRSREALERELMRAPIPVPSSSPSDEHAARCCTIPEKLASMFKGDVDAIVLTALAKDPSDRYCGVQEFADDIERWLEASSPLPRANSRRARAMKLSP